MMLMKFESSFALCLAILFAATASRPAFSQEAANAKAPFTLTIAGNLVPGSRDQWDFANPAVINRKAGEPVFVMVRKTNVSDDPITKGTLVGDFYGYHYDVLDSSGTPVQRKPQSGFVRFSVQGPVTSPWLQPGESLLTGDTPTHWLQLSQPGTYTIQAWAHAWDDPKSPIVRSNTLTLIIEPADASAPQ